MYREVVEHGSLIMTISETDMKGEDWAIDSYLQVKRLITSLGIRCAISKLYMLIALFF